MTDSTGDGVSMHRFTNDTTKGDSVQGVAEEQANFMRAVSIGLKDLDSGREISSDDAATRVWPDRGTAP